MFNTDPKSLPFQPKPGPAPMTAPTPVARSSAAPVEGAKATSRATPSSFAPAANAPSGTSVIGTDLTILGDRITIISANKLQVDGDIRGNVHGRQVVVTEEGSVVGRVSAETIEVRGGVRGSIRAVSVKLHATAQVEGDITHQKLTIAEGAEFDGKVHRIKDAAELMPVLDPEAIEHTQVSGGAATPFDTTSD